MAVLVNLNACDQDFSAPQKIKSHLEAIWFKLVDGETEVSIPLAQGVEVIENIAYGSHDMQGMDLYRLPDAQAAPIIMNLHGGGWTTGNKNETLSYINKVNRWVPKGFIVISVDTRLMPDADVYAQIDDLAKAVSFVQQHAADWGGDGGKLILMGHSSAGTMVSVLATSPSIVTQHGGQAWLASVAIDSSSLDIERSMRLWSPGMISHAYGAAADRWLTASPIHLLSKHSLPMLLACSTLRGDAPCEQAALFVAKAEALGLRTAIVPQDFDHGGVDFNLGVDAAYTQTVETFMASLDTDVARLLTSDGE